MISLIIICCELLFVDLLRFMYEIHKRYLLKKIIMWLCGTTETGSKWFAGWLGVYPVIFLWMDLNWPMATERCMGCLNLYWE